MSCLEVLRPHIMYRKFVDSDLYNGQVTSWLSAMMIVTAQVLISSSMHTDIPISTNLERYR